MKQKISPAMMAAAVIGLLVVVGFIGYRVMFPEVGAKPVTTSQKMTPEQEVQYNNSSQKSGPNTHGMSASDMQQYNKMQGKH